MQEDQRGLLPILGPLSRQRKFFCDRVPLALGRDRVPLALGGDRVFHVATGF